MDKLDELIKFYVEEKCYACSESLLLAANEVWELGLSDDMLRTMSGFAGGMGDGCVCGAISAGIAVLGAMFCRESGNESPQLMVRTKCFMQRCRQSLGAVDCAELSGKCLASGTSSVTAHVLEVAEILRQVIAMDCAAPWHDENIMRMSPQTMAEKMKGYFEA